MSPEDDWGPALAIHRAEHYPLQIPEARRPVEQPSSVYANGDLSSSDIMGGNGKASFMHDDLMSSSLAEPAVPSFERETAI